MEILRLYLKNIKKIFMVKDNFAHQVREDGLEMRNGIMTILTPN